MSNWIVNVNNITSFIWALENYFTVTGINILDVHSKFALKWQTLIGFNTLTWAPNTTETWPIPFQTFSLHILIISKLHKSWVYRLYSCWLNVCSYLIINWWVSARNNYPSTKDGLLGKLGVNLILLIKYSQPMLSEMHPKSTLSKAWEIRVLQN